MNNNLSHKLVARLNDIFPDSTHVMMEKLDESNDRIIWKFAEEKGFAIVAKDADYNEISALKGFPPKVIRLTVGNCKIPDIEKIIRSKAIILNEFYHNKNSGIIEID